METQKILYKNDGNLIFFVLLKILVFFKMCSNRKIVFDYFQVCRIELEIVYQNKSIKKPKKA